MISNRFFEIAALFAATQGADAGARVERVAADVFVIIHEDAVRTWPSGATDWPHGNTGVVIGDDGVLVVDAAYFPARAAADIALIRRLTDKPLRYLVNTHWHPDHTSGNSVYRAAFPGIAIISSRVNRDYIALNQERYRARALAASHPSRAELTRLEGLLARGADSSGRAWTPDERRTLEQRAAERRQELSELAAISVAPPDSVFVDRLVLSLGNRRVELRDRGHANSPSDVTVYLPAERVLFTGDILVHPVPYAFASYPTFWIAVLRDIEATPLTALVPGHGPVMRDASYARQVRRLLETVQERVRPLLARGLVVEQARRNVELSDLSREFNPQGSPALEEIWRASIVDALILRTFQCLQGVTC